MLLGLAIVLSFGLMAQTLPHVSDANEIATGVYDNKTIAGLITVITTTNPIPSMPNTRLLCAAQTSLNRSPILALCKKIIVFDGVQPGYAHRAEDYELYKKCVAQLTQNLPAFANTELVFCSSWQYIGGAVREAMKRVTTPFVFLHQHDLILTKDVDFAGIIATMIGNPRVKYVGLMDHSENTAFSNDRVDDVIEGFHCVPLCRTFGYSDRCHVARTEFYREFVLPQCGNFSMEEAMNPIFGKAKHTLGMEEAHRIFGTYLYGNLTDGGYHKHVDGRGTSQPKPRPAHP